MGTLTHMAQDDAILRLAKQIDATRKNERFRVDADEVATLRRQGSSELHSICADFVSSVNSRLSEAVLELSPPVYAPEMFREPGVNVMQISSQGRQIQIVFEATPDVFSTEKFAIPYILEGEVRTYNQKMLERSEIRSLQFFFCVERESAVWRFYDWRTLRTGLVSRQLMVDLMEPLF